mgnify:CR=1 FL=1
MKMNHDPMVSTMALISTSFQWNSSPAMLVMASDNAPNRTVLCAGAGTFEAAHITLTQGIHIGTGDDVPEQLAARLAEVTDRQGDMVPQSGSAQGSNEVGKALSRA